MISTEGKEKIAQFASDLLDEMEVDIGGVTETIPFVVDSLDGVTVIVAGLVNETMSGLITEVRVKDTVGITYDSRTENIDKPLGTLLLLSFVFNVTAKVVDV